ncbi:MAG: hypothetical protein IMZ66_01890, partial [Planctomycetes bacterium]|nr:hypothetical protein [Planctomycetota bacterium]
AERSVYQLPIEAEALRAMAERARQLAELMPQTPLGDGLDADVLARLARLQELSGEGQKELADLQREFERLMAARQTLAESPFEAQQQYADLMTQLRAQQAMHQMAGLNDYFQSQQELLGAMREQMAALRGRTESADAQALAAISAKQQELDPAALELMRRAQQLLQDRLEKMQQDRDLLPPAPWVPPGRREQAMPLEADTPEEDPRPETAGKPDLEAMRRRLDTRAAEQPDDWWDQPVDVPATPVTLEENDRFAGRRRPTDPAAPWMTEGFETPRRMLMQHQDQLYQSLTANSSRMSAVQGQLGQVMSQLEQAMMPMQGQWQVSGPLSPDAMQQLQQTLGSRAMQQMMGMLSQAATQMAQARSGMPWASAQASGMDSQAANRIARPGMVLSVDLGGADVPPGQGAALYRLPPWMRQPLVEGMQERGPEAYQPLIDAYYRQLSTEVESPSGGGETAPPPAPPAQPPAQPAAPAPQPPASAPQPPAPAPKAEPPATPPAPPPAPPATQPPPAAPPAPAAPEEKKEAKPGS